MISYINLKNRVVAHYLCNGRCLEKLFFFDRNQKMTMIQVLGLLSPASAPRPPRKTASDGGGQVNHHCDSSYYRILIKRIELISV